MSALERVCENCGHFESEHAIDGTDGPCERVDCPCLGFEAETIVDSSILRDNPKRARRGREMIKLYRERFDGPNEDFETVLTDMLADLMHWGSRKRSHRKYSRFEFCLERARNHFEAEEAGVL